MNRYDKLWIVLLCLQIAISMSERLIGVELCYHLTLILIILGVSINILRIVREEFKLW